VHGLHVSEAMRVSEPMCIFVSFEYYATCIVHYYYGA
jgi:hypothetical protein